MRLGTHLAGGLPSGMLGLEEAMQLFFVELDLETGQQLTHHAGVLDLFDGAGHPEQRHVALAEPLRSLLVPRKPVGWPPR